MNDVACAIQEIGEALLGKVQPLSANPFEGLELGNRAIASISASI